MASSTMNAVRVHRFGGPDVIRTEAVPVPTPEADEVLVRVTAAGVGPWDGLVRAGRSVLPQPLPLTLGSDVAGVVEQVGDAVEGFKSGDAVYGVTNPRFTGAYAELAACKEAMIARKPGTLTFAEAASAPVVAVTAWQMLFDEARLTKGQTVIVQGAAGSVGRYAVMLARDAGLRVVGTDVAPLLETVIALGADEAVLASDLAGRVGSADAAIDLVGGELQPQLLHCVKRGGAFVSAVSAPSAREAAERGVRAGFMLVGVRTRYLEAVAARFEDGRLRPHVGTLLRLADARLAHEMLEGNRPAEPGKIVLEVG